MKFFKNREKAKTCPRCGLKYYGDIKQCPDCGFIFSRLKFATNKDAKKKILRRDKDYIVKTNQLPGDVSFVKLLLLCIFLGPLGAHCFYVGRYARGSILLLDMLMMIFMVIFNGPLMAIQDGAVVASISTVAGMIMLIWPFDLFFIITKMFKVPVAIDLKGDETIDQLEEMLENEDKVDENNEVQNNDNKNNIHLNNTENNNSENIQNSDGDNIIKEENPSFVIDSDNEEKRDNLASNTENEKSKENNNDLSKKEN